MKSYSINILLALVIVSTFSCIILNYFDLPEVHFNSNNECVRVINYLNTNYNCENLPEKYISFYVNE